MSHSAFVRALALVGLLMTPTLAMSDPVTVRHPSGRAHVPLVLRDLAGTVLADGDWTESMDEGGVVTSRLVFRFRDSSFYDETTTFSQRQQFRLMREQLVLAGPSFPQPLDMRVDVPAGEVRVRAAGARQDDVRRMVLPSDLANGLVPTLLENVPRGAPLPTFGYIAAMAKPRLVKLVVTAAREESVPVTGDAVKATHYVLHVQIGGLAGALAPLAGKQPPDSHVWIRDGDEPSFVKSEQPLYVGGPLWRIELAGPR